jgi:hypothetical protein
LSFGFFGLGSGGAIVGVRSSGRIGIAQVLISRSPRHCEEPLLGDEAIQVSSSDFWIAALHSQ